MALKVAINGMGRIGRCTLAAIIESGRKDIEVVAINAPMPLETLAHLLKYDSIHGKFPGEVRIMDDKLFVGQHLIEMQATRDLDRLEWNNIDVVMECTGAFNSKEASSAHLGQGAKGS